MLLINILISAGFKPSTHPMLHSKVSRGPTRIDCYCSWRRQLQKHLVIDPVSLQSRMNFTGAIIVKCDNETFNFVLLLIISKHLRKVLSYLVAGDGDVNAFSRTAVSHEPNSPIAAALTAGQQVPVSAFTSHCVTTAEILSPPSVTEQTTNLLDNK